MSNLRQQLDRHTHGALTDMNAICRTEGAEGYITVIPEDNDVTFIFTAYKHGGTTFFRQVRVPGGKFLGEEIQESEDFRLLRKKVAGKKPQRVTWN